MRFKWPASQQRTIREDGIALDHASEESLRQKILVSWLLAQPPIMQVATRELVTYGSQRWSTYSDPDPEVASWWDLPDDLESEHCEHSENT
jgi:hypothetical protein